MTLVAGEYYRRQNPFTKLNKKMKIEHADNQVTYNILWFYMAVKWSC
jgi:hypothetical protein